MPTSSSSSADSNATIEVHEFDVSDDALVRQVADLALSLDITSMSPEQSRSGSFLTLPAGFGPATVKQLATLPSVVATAECGKLAGFMLASKVVDDPPSAVLQGLMQSFATSGFRHLPSAVYGPIGVEAGHQGRGVAPMMFGMLVQQLRSNGQQVMIGFVDEQNQPSLALHTTRLRFNTIGTFRVGERDYVAIVYDLR